MNRRTRILATLGPASADPAVLEALFAAGLDAVRLNFSHGTHGGHAQALQAVRAAAARCGREVAVLQDLQGPKIRLGAVAGALRVERGEPLTLTTRKVVGAAGLVSTDHAHLPTDVAVGTRILLDEGRVGLVVRAIEGTEVHCLVTDGGVLSSNKGLSIPGASLTVDALTEKDRADLAFGLALGVDYVALSFVRRASDVEVLRQLLRAAGAEASIIAKIETPQAVEAIDEIVAAADGVMVARGDLAIEAPLELVPAHQKKIIARANWAGKLVITATQMLESMTESPLPTRAEVADVANAVLDGTDAVMLSGETAVGKHPVEAVRRMASIAATAEETLYPFERPVRGPGDAALGFGPVATRAAALAAREATAKAIVVLTQSGRTAALLSDERPRAPIIAFAREVSVVRRLALYWGVRAFLAPPGWGEDWVRHAARFVLERGLASPGDPAVFVLGAKGADDDARAIELLRLSPEPPGPR